MQGSSREENCALLCSKYCDKEGDNTPRAVGWVGTAPGSIREIQEELKKGPMIAKLFANDKKKMLKKYENGVLKVPKYLYEKEEPDHFVALLGFDTVADPPYWLITNTWGENWGERGFAKLLFGNNTLLLEANAYALIPQKKSRRSRSADPFPSPKRTPSAYMSEYFWRKDLPPEYGDLQLQHERTLIRMHRSHPPRVQLLSTQSFRSFPWKFHSYYQKKG